jgi:hypothetical protein
MSVPGVPVVAFPGTAGVQPAMSAERENIFASSTAKTSRLRRVAGGTPAVPVKRRSSVTTYAVIVALTV